MHWKLFMNERELNIKFKCKLNTQYTLFWVIARMSAAQRGNTMGGPVSYGSVDMCG